MQDFLTTLLQCSVSMSLVTLVYAAILPLLSKRYAAKWRYMVWLVIVAGWIFPFRPRIDLSFLPAQMIDIPVAPMQPITNIIPSMADTRDIVNAPATIPLWWVLAAIWVLGAVCVIVYHTLWHGHFMKMVRRWSEPVTDMESLEILDSLKLEIGIREQVGLSVCQSITSPMLVGAFRPVILLPPTKIASDELSFILKHELIHLKRHDIWYKVLILAAISLHWYNPIVYLMAKAAAVQCEISCDALVLQGADFQQRKQYGETIIGVVRNGAKLRTALSTDFYGGKKGMKNRISSIMDLKRKKAGIVILCVVLVAIIGTGVALAATNKDTDNKPGIIENVNDQLDTDVEFTNGWRSPLVDLEENGEGGELIIVQVGSLKSDPEQGIAVVCHQNKDSGQYVVDDTFLTPTKHGAIKIQSLGAKDFTMEVIAEDGYEWILNIYNGFYNNGDEMTATAANLEKPDANAGNSGGSNNETLSVDAQVIKEIIEGFSKAYFSGDIETIKTFLTNPYEWDIDVYQNVKNSADIADVSIKGLNDLGEKNVNEVSTVSLEFKRYTEDDTFQYLTIKLVKQSDGWKIQFYGLEM